jgi:sulfatase modifying factor 1
MRKLYFGFIIISSILASCKSTSGGGGELVGVYNKKFKNNRVPLGMTYVPPGRTLIGQSDEDINKSYDFLQCLLHG